MAYNAMPGEDGPCLCDPCVCDHDCGISPMYKSQERGGEMGEDQVCRCDPCECETPPGSPSKSKMNLDEGAGDGNPYQLDEFARAKEFFMNTSTKSGLCMYEHLVQVIRKILDERGPMNPVDYLEEVSMNVKRYKFQIPKDIIRDVFQISPPLLDDARYLTSHWKRVNRYIGSEFEGEDGEEDYSQGYVGGSFQNLLRLAYYLEQISIGLPREEMFRLAIAIRELTVSRPYITRARFWGKIFGIRKGYYVVETEFRTTDSGIGDLWTEPDNSNGEMEGEGQEIMAIEEQKLEDVTAEDLNAEEILGAQKTLMRAGNVVLDTDFLSPYSKTSGLPPEKIAQLLPKAKNADDFQPLPEQKTLGLEYGGEGYMMNMSEMVGEGGAPVQLEDTEALEDAAKWHGFMEEFMSNFPQAFIEPEVTVPAEPLGTGINRRAFYVCSSLGEPWILLPISTPELLNGSRNIRWALTGELNAPIRSYPEYPGKEAHYLRSLLARAAAGSLASPKGFYRPSAFPGEYPGEDEEDVEEEEESLNAPGEDKVNQVKKYDVSLNLITNPNLDFWVHHAAYILPQGRATWWNPMSLNKPPKKKSFDEDEDDEDEDEDEYDEFEGEEDVPATNAPGRELGPPLFTPISSDTSIDGRKPWTLSTSTSIFLEFQVVSIRSNTWPGSTCICTMKGKVDNIYFGDGLKFADRTYCPAPPPPSAAEYKFGPEISEISDPTVEEEQDWLNKLELSQIADIEPKFEDNEVVGEDEEEEETEYESDDDY